MRIVETASIGLEGAPNFRDLGGLTAADGRAVRRGRVFRSGHLARLTEPDLVALEGIRTVVDFRSRTGIEIFGPDRLPDGVRYVSLPIGQTYDPAMRAAMAAGRFSELPGLVEGNRALIRDHAAEFGRLMLLIADASALPLVFHCIGGKDRTGVAAALLLSMLGVPWPTVRADYLASNVYFAPSIDARLARLEERAGGSPDPADIEAARRFFIVEEGYIEAAFDEILTIAGSLDAYVTRNMNVPEVAVQRIREHLLELEGAAP